jgi:hypothetical protein
MQLACPRRQWLGWPFRGSTASPGCAMKLAFAALTICAAVVPVTSVLAEDAGERLETIVVTGSKISYRDLLDTPAVSITRPADYLLLSMTLINDTRSEEGRRNEIHATIEKMLHQAGKRFELVYGGDSFTSVLNDKNFHIPLEKEEKRADVNKVSVFVRVAIGGDPAHAEELTQSLHDFVRKAERVGRTEIEGDKETALSLSRPERFRYELIKAIAEDTDKVRATLGAGCEVSLTGLSSRIDWHRVSASELMLDIPYTMEIKGCGLSQKSAP